MNNRTLLWASGLAAFVIGLGWLTFNKRLTRQPHHSAPAALAPVPETKASVPSVAAAVTFPPVAGGVAEVSAHELRKRLLAAQLPLAERLLTAETRAAWLRTVLVTNAELALAEALSFAEYAALPLELQARVERPFSLAAEWRALPVCAAEAASHGVDVPETVYSLAVDGEYLKAYPVGARAGVGSKQMTAMQGVMLGNLAAVRGETLQVLSAADEAAARNYFGMSIANSDATRDFFTDEPIVGQPVTAVAGGQLFRFALAANVQRLNQELAAMEAKPGPKTSGTPLLLGWSTNGVSSGGFNLEQVWAAADLQASTWTETMKKLYGKRHA